MSTPTVIRALPNETEIEYDKRNIDQPKLYICKHNYDGQYNIKFQLCNFCKCSRHNSYVNKNYDIYFDDYM